jgi:hypothetical protein
MINLKKLLCEGKEWIRYGTLTPSQKKAVYEYMVTSGDVEVEEYNQYVNNFVYKIQVVPAEKISSILERDWGWDWQKTALTTNDEARIQKISKEIDRTKQKWPYIVNAATSFSQWAENEHYHGDGFHRMCLSIRKNEPIEFLFLKKIR